MPPLFDRRVSRRASLLGLVAALSLPADRADAQSAVDVAAPALGTADALAGRLATWYETASRRAPGQWGIAVADETGRMVWSVNPDEPLVPASTVKLFTTGFARSVLGGSARRSTRVVGRGGLDPETGVWQGSWALELNGDPTLEREQGSGPTFYDLALQLASAGIRKITGPLQVKSANGPANAVYPAAWSDRHRGRLFAPPVGPLTLHENIVWIVVRPGRKVGHKARLIETAPEGITSLVTVSATTKSGRRSRLRLRRRKDGGWIVTGSIGVRASSRRLTAVATNPEAVLNAVWGSALARAGISWDRTPRAAAAPEGEPQILAEVASAPLDSLASEINRRSLNLGAELLLQWAGGRERANERLTQHVREVIGSSEGVYLADGSGLSYDDRVAPSAFISYLAKFPATAAGQNFPQLLPANGTGTLRRLNTGFPEQGVVRAKTGTLGQVSTVAGYLGTQNGVLLISLMYNGRRPWAARQAQWKLFRELGADGVVIPTDSVPAPPVQMGGEES
ncbi:MAG: D-alanyl-D-alanine carboxypeptidase/D-alanyl-D-alanine endopeptidase [Gemmatimonadales bacterium]